MTATARGVEVLRNYQRATRGRRFVALGVFAAVVFPLLGVMFGVVLLFRHRVLAGLGCILLGALAGAVYYLLEQSSVFAGSSTRWSAPADDDQAGSRNGCSVACRV
jgi:hypothetical protein